MHRVVMSGCSCLGRERWTGVGPLHREVDRAIQPPKVSICPEKRKFEGPRLTAQQMHRMEG